MIIITFSDFILFLNINYILKYRNTLHQNPSKTLLQIDLNE